MTDQPSQESSQALQPEDAKQQLQDRLDDVKKLKKVFMSTIHLMGDTLPKEQRGTRRDQREALMALDGFELAIIRIKERTKEGELGIKMIRFVDIREANTGSRFAWWDTVTDKFLTVDGDMAWNVFSEFEESVKHDKERTRYVLDRFRRLCPDWAFVEPEEDES